MVLYDETTHVIRSKLARSAIYDPRYALSCYL